ncbi:MAG: DUF4160 domain-containing protein [FCB group bacterium]
MPEISRFYGIVIAMYYDEHNPPHFHARYEKYKISLKIKDFSILDGELPPKALGLVVEWASLHKDELLTNWEMASQGKPVNSIEPI